MLTAPSGRDRGLELIAALKFVKAALLALAGVGALSLLRSDIAAGVHEWLAELAVRRGQQIVQQIVQRALALLDVAQPIQIEAAGITSIVYGLLFVVEGVGLWKGQRWAEWLTVIATGSLIPFEIYELLRRPTVVRALALVTNVAVVAYLAYRLRHPDGGPRPSRRPAASAR